MNSKLRSYGEQTEGQYFRGGMTQLVVNTIIEILLLRVIFASRSKIRSL